MLRSRAVEVILIGVAIALIASNGFDAAGADWAEGLTGRVPIGEVAVIVSILVAALWPARRAARIHPAADLRITDWRARGA